VVIPPGVFAGPERQHPLTCHLYEFHKHEARTARGDSLPLVLAAEARPQRSPAATRPGMACD